jgi:adenosylcobinamide amidohydrolase
MIARPESSAWYGAEPELSVDRRTLAVRFGVPHQVLSWAIVGGGRRIARSVLWRYVRDEELSPSVDAGELLEHSGRALGLVDPVGLLTARNLDAFEQVSLRGVDHAVRCVATIGLGNALRVGDPPGPFRPVGTINLLCQLSGPVTEEALVETLAIAVEARTAAVLALDLPSRRTGRPATGTGTDCVVVAAPVRESGARWAGKHTELGALVGAAVEQAITRGGERWLAELKQ